MGNFVGTQWPEGRFGHEAAVFGNRVFVWGGAHEHKGRNCSFADRTDMWCLNTMTGRWQKRKARVGQPEDTPPPCIDARCAVLDGIVYSFGGCTDMGTWSCLNDVYALDIEEMQWKRVQTKGNKPSERTGCGMCTIQNSLLVIGGYGKQAQEMLPMGSQFKENTEYDNNYGWSNDVLLFSPLSRSWRPVNTKGSHPPPRAHHTLTTWIEQKVILFGGRSQNSRLNDLYVLNMSTEEWSQVTKSLQSEWPDVRSAHTASSLSSSHLLILGGWDQHHGVTSDNYIIDVEKASAQKITCVGQATGRANHSVCCQQCPDDAVSIITVGGTKAPVCFKKKGLPDVLVYRWELSQPTVLEEMSFFCKQPSSTPTIASTNSRHEVNIDGSDETLAAIN